MKAERGEDIELILKTKKENNSGILSNERLLMIKAGIISYFSEAPKKFTATSTSKFLQTSGQFPKYTIKANDIDHMELKGSTLSMLFKKSKLISKNEFQDMVKKKEIEPDRYSEISAGQQVGGFVKWNFECDNQQQLKEFYRYTNLFRANNPKFVPSLSAVISTFRGQKRPPQARQMSMKPSASTKMNELDRQRLSEVVPTSNGKDLFMDILDRNIQAKQQSKQQAKNVDAKPSRESQNERLNKLKSRISTMHLPMERIDEKDNQDKLSEMSRQPIDTKHELKRTISQIVEQVEPKKEEIVTVQQPLSQQMLESAVLPLVQQVKKVQPEVQQEIVQIKQQKAQIKQEEHAEQPVPLQPQPAPLQPQPVPLQPVPLQPQPQEIPTIIQEPVEAIKPAQSIPIEVYKEEPLAKSNKKVKISQVPLLNNSYDLQSITTQEQSTKRKRRKLHQFLKASTYIDNFNPQQVSKKLSISLQHLQQLIKSHSKQEESSWAFIENNLAFHLNKQKTNTNTHTKLTIHDEVIKEYYQLGQQHEQSGQFLKIPLQGQISYIEAEPQNEQQLLALQWMEQQIKNSTPRQFSTKIINKTHFKIYIRQIDFKRQNIKHLKGAWIVNRNGHLQQFLAYLRLQKVVKEISSANDIELILAETIYLRYKQFEGIGKEWRVGYPCLPMKSIKSLQYITRSKEMQLFFRDYPQFNILTEIIKQGYKYRLHLDRIDAEQSKRDNSVLLHQLKKLIFPFDNELDLFYQNDQYTNIQNYCLQQIHQVLSNKKRIDKEHLYAIMETMENNISVDTLCKLMGCRIDKKGNIYFYHTILRLGGRQFGEQISLIKRWKKKGNTEMGRQLSKRLMGKLHQYQTVTPISHFIQIYLHIIDFMIVNEGELHRVVPILLKVLSHLGKSEVQQYPIYLALMKTYLKLGEMQNFIKTLENCRLFISEMFKQFAPLLDYSLQRIVIIILLKEDTQRALDYSYKLLKQIQQNTYFSQNIKEKYISKLEWDKNNILLSLGQHYKAFTECLNKLNQIQEANTYYPDYWIEGVLCLSKCWLNIQQINSINSAQLQKRIGCAIQLAFSRQNLEMVFVLFQTGTKVLTRCQQLNLPTLLQSLSSFQQAKIEFNQTQTQIFYILAQYN